MGALEDDLDEAVRNHSQRMRLADAAWQDVREEIWRATRRYPEFNSTHEGYAVIKEELDELWEAVRGNNRQDARAEAVQVAAMAIRFLMDIRRT